MQDFGMNSRLDSKLNRLRAVFAAVFILLTVFSVFFAAAEAGHDCSGDACPICFVIQVAEQNAKLLSLALCAAGSFFARRYFALKLSFKNSYQTFFNNSLISLKTRLNN